jgi:hypothetical protein
LQSETKQIVTAVGVWAFIAVALLGFGYLVIHPLSGFLGSGVFRPLWDFGNSNFFIALVTALAGAGTGALGAQWIISRNEVKRRLLEEIRATNAAIMVAFEIVNTFLSLKSQHVRRLIETYDRQEQEFLAIRDRRQRGLPISGVLEVLFDFETLTHPHTPMDLLQQLLFEKISVGGRALSAMTRLLGAMDALEDALRQRNEFIAQCKVSPPDQNTMIALYFGVPTSTGRVDRTYPSSLRAIASYNDDIIFFSKALIDDLAEHGRRLMLFIGKGAPKAFKPEFGMAHKQNLIPPDEQYQDWLDATKGVAQR